MYQDLDEVDPPELTSARLARIKSRGRRIRSTRATVGIAGFAVIVAGATAVALPTSPTGHKAQHVNVVSPIPHGSSATTAPATSATSAPATTTTTAPAATTSATQEQADALLHAFILPPGANRVSSLSGPDFSFPFDEPACQPVSDASDYWTVPGTMLEVYNYLRAHPPAWIPWTSYGTPAGAANSSSNGYGVGGTPTTSGYQSGDELVAEIYQVANNVTGIRADGLALPPDASCTQSGGPANGVRINDAPG